MIKWLAAALVVVASPCVHAEPTKSPAEPPGPAFERVKYEMVTLIHRDDGGKDSADLFDMKRVK
jgi:hypothetical protein